MVSPPLLYPDDFRTPAFVVDMDRVRRNAGAMQAKARALGVRLRPHVKTHKTAAMAKIQVQHGFNGITVSTMKEARHFAGHGFSDILYAFPITPDKLAEAAEVATKCAFSVLVDHPKAAEAILRHFEGSPVQLGVWIKIDTGANRAGLQPHDGRIPEMAARLDRSEGVRFCGVLTHAGQSYLTADTSEIDHIVHLEARILVEVAERIEASGVACHGRSLGSTPAAVHAHDDGVYCGITEMRPGNYIFYDRYMAESGHCQMEDIACHVATRIAGIYPERNRILVDAGALALSKDPGPTHLRGYDEGFGVVRGYPDLHLVKLSQEHGMIAVAEGFDRFHLGQILEIVPNHSCLTAAMFPEYATVEQGRITGQLEPIRGW